MSEICGDEPIINKKKYKTRFLVDFKYLKFKRELLETMVDFGCNETILTTISSFCLHFDKTEVVVDAKEVKKKDTDKLTKIK